MITTYHGKNIYIANKQIRERVSKLNPMNISDLDAPTLNELVEEVNTSPLFATRKIVIVRSLTNLTDNTKLIGVLENKKTTSHVIFIINEYGKKYEKLAAYLRKSQVIKINLFTEHTAKQYTKNEAKRLKINIEEKALDYFLFVTGLAPEAIDTELNNLNKPDIKNVSINTIREFCSRRTEANIFKITQSFFSDKPDTALNLMIPYINENPTNLDKFINFLIADLKLAIMIKSCKERHNIPANPYRIKMIKKHTGDFTLHKLTEFFCVCNQAIYEKKRVGVSPLPIIYKGFFRFREI